MISNLYFKKYQKIIDVCKDKNVLDIGIVDHDVRYSEREDWLHGKIKKCAKTLVGLDIDKKSIEILKKRGYDARFANAENFDLRKKFDVIVAGDLIEHLANPGNFLESVKKHMNENTRFIITTPNCLSLSNFIELLFFGKIKYINNEHMLWYDANTLQHVLKKYGFAIKELSFIAHNPIFFGESTLKRLFKRMRHALIMIVCSIRKQSAPTIYLEATLLK